MIKGHHAVNPLLDDNRRFLFQCVVDTLNYTIPNRTPFLGPQPLDCLNPDLTNIALDKHSIHVARADIYTGTFIEHFPFDISNPLQKAERELTLASTYAANSVYYLAMKLRLVTYRAPKDPVAIRQILADMEAFHQDNEYLQFLAAAHYAKHLADWDKALPLADKLLKTKPTEFSIAHWVYIYYYIAAGDWDNAKITHDFTPKVTGKGGLVVLPAIACFTNMTELYTSITASLKSEDLFEKDKYIAFIKLGDRHESIESQLIRPEMFETCPVFQTAE